MKTVPLAATLLCSCLVANFVFAAGSAPALVPSQATVPNPAKLSSPSVSGLGVKLPQPKRDWTVMVYANGKNDLAPDMWVDTHEMETAGSGPRVNVVVELGLIKNDQGIKDMGVPAWNGVRRFLVTQDSDLLKMGSIELPAEPYADMGSHRHLVHFVSWAKANFPAKKYMLIVSNHGLGLFGISFDDVSGKAIYPFYLAKALKEVGGVDVYGSDACLMQMAEIVYRLKGTAKVVVGSQEIEPNAGYDYTAIVQGLNANPGMSAEDAGRLVVESFSDSYAGTGEIATLSAVKMSALDGLSPLVDKWITAVQTSPDARAPLVKALRKARRFDEPSFRDLHHFVELVSCATTDAALQKAGLNLMKYMEEKVVLANAQKGYRKANGLAVYIPMSGNILDAYETTAFSKATRWGSFLQWMRSHKLLLKDLQTPRPKVKTESAPLSQPDEYTD